MLFSQQKLNKETELSQFQYFQEANNNFQYQVNMVQRLLQFVADPEIRFRGDQESIQEIYNLIQKLPKAENKNNVEKTKNEMN